MKKQQEKDIILKRFWRDNRRFADLFNTVLFQGRPVLDPDQLSELDSDVSNLLETKEHKETMTRIRDIVKKRMHVADFMILGIENQSSVHYAMPLRIMVYDALGYLKEYEEMARQNRKEGCLSDSAEFLSGLRKTDRLHPVITLVVYYGETPWDGPLTLKDMLRIPDELRDIVSNYEIHLLQVLDTDQYEFQNEEVRAVFEISRYIFRENYDLLGEKYKNRPVSKDAVEVISTITDSGDIMCYAKENMDQGGADMCRALEKLKEQSRNEGKKTVLINMLKNGLTISETARLSGEDVDEVERIYQELFSELQALSC